MLRDYYVNHYDGVLVGACQHIEHRGVVGLRCIARGRMGMADYANS